VTRDTGLIALLACAITLKLYAATVPMPMLRQDYA